MYPSTLRICHPERSEEPAFSYRVQAGGAGLQACIKRRGNIWALATEVKKAVAPPVSSGFWKKGWANALLLFLLSAPLLAADSAARFNTLGHRMICSCGCNQILLECNHVGCPSSDGMRSELSAAIARGDSDDLILQAFVQKYGPTILAAPPAVGFNRVAWIMPFVILLLAIGTAIVVIKNWKQPQVAEAPGLPPGLRDEIRRETEL
jgi:cytochrome c-type biogenesis protein CcmH